MTTGNEVNKKASEVTAVPLTLWDDVKKALLKQEWLQNHNVDWGLNGMWVSGMMKEISITGDTITITSYIESYDGGYSIGMKRTMTEIIYDADIDLAVDIIKGVLEED